MNIKDNRKNTVQFKELQIGDVFEVKTDEPTNVICMKTPYDKKYDRNAISRMENAVRFSDGYFMFIDLDTEVVPLKATLYIKEKNNEN